MEVVCKDWMHMDLPTTELEVRWWEKRERSVWECRSAWFVGVTQRSPTFCGGSKDVSAVTFGNLVTPLTLLVTDVDDPVLPTTPLILYILSMVLHFH